LSTAAKALKLRFQSDCKRFHGSLWLGYAQAGDEMETVFADWASRTATLTAERSLETGEGELPENEGISARGLEILQVLNDVFNTLPHQGRESGN